MGVLPSRHQIGDICKLSFNQENNTGRIHSIKFTESKVYYDVIISLDDGYETLVKEIDSCFVDILPSKENKLQHELKIIK